MFIPLKKVQYVFEKCSTYIKAMFHVYIKNVQCVLKIIIKVKKAKNNKQTRKIEKKHIESYKTSPYDYVTLLPKTNLMSRPTKTCGHPQRLVRGETMSRFMRDGIPFERAISQGVPPGGSPARVIFVG